MTSTFSSSCISESLTVFADENQRITGQQSTIAEIRAATGIHDTLKLTRNYRNTRPIAEFAASFYTGLPSGIPELPPSSARGERPFLIASRETPSDDRVHPQLREQPPRSIDWNTARAQAASYAVLQSAKRRRRATR